jgi:2-dehydropantoate 2-reductase
MRVAIYGTGGAGGYFGAQLARTGGDVTFIARRPALKSDSSSRFMRRNARRGDRHPACQSHRRSEADCSRRRHFTRCKSLAGGGAARDMRPMVGPQTFVVPLQNGVEASSQLTAALGAEHVLGGLCGTFSWVAAPGRIRNIGTSSFIKFGELDNRRSERAERLRQSFDKAGVK